MTSTFDWLCESLIPTNEEITLVRLGRKWTHVAAFSSCGSIFAIYKDDLSYCVHAGDEWETEEEPNLGYFDRNLSYNDLLNAVAQKYDTIRNSVVSR